LKEVVMKSQIANIETISRTAYMRPSWGRGILKKLAAIALLGFATLSFAVAGIPDCVPGKLSDYEKLEATGCLIGDKKFSNFQYHQGHAGLPGDAISLTPGTISESDDVGLLFEGKWTSASEDSYVTYNVEVQPQGKPITGASLEMQFGEITGAGKATVLTDLCPMDGTSGRRWLLRIAFAIALLGGVQAAHADKIIVTYNGVPVASGTKLPAGFTNFKQETVKDPGKDLYWSIITFDVPPPPAPQTYRVVLPSGAVMVIGDGTEGKPKQVGDSVVLTYTNGGETVEWKGTLLKPGDPNPSPGPPREGTMNGVGSFLPPATALADAEELLKQPELGYIFSSPIDLSYFQYNFYGAVDFPIFLRDYTVNYTDGTVDSMQIVPEPGSLLLLGSGILGLGGFLRKRWLARS
jgi:hypothetical protein